MQFSANKRSKGFALLITITLLAFLVLLLVSLASLTRVETQVASNNQNLAQARQNALMALNIALGELQKYTGPDQRTTARSDILDIDVNPATFTPPPSGRWLGAYGSGAEADYAMVPSALSTAVVNASDTKGSQAKLLNWLVSGNETTAFDPASHVGVKGNITTPPSTFQFPPTGAVTGLSASVSALTSNLTITDKDNAAKPARLLVGPNTAGNSITDYVVAPLRDITAEAPGMGTTPVPVGRYAWWVGDEGAKARVNLPMANAAQAANAFASSQRAAVELVDRVNPSGSTSLAATQMLDPNGTDSRYNPNSPLLAKLLSADQLPMLSASATTALSTAAKYRYHDLTAWSVSVLSDTYAGGLKKDLSAVLAKNAITPLPTDSIFPAETNTGSQTNQFGMPTWGQLRSHVQTFGLPTGIPPRGPTMQRLTPTAPIPTPTSVGVSPVMTYSTLGLTYGVPPSAMPPFDEVGKPLRLAFFPVVVLWNPYTSPIAAAKYQVGFRKFYDSELQLQYYDAAATPPAWVALDNFNLDANRYLRFVIDAPAIPAGKSYIFTLKTSGNTYVAADVNNPLEFGFRPGNHALVQSTLSIAQTGRQYRVGVNGRGTIATAVAADSGYIVPKTLLGSSTHSFGRGTPFYSYLAPHNAIAPPSEFPYNPTTMASLGWYQSIGSIDTGNNITPYGLNPGYSRSQLRNGLIRNEGPIEMITEPTFRMSFRAAFQGSRNRWIAHGNPRAFMIDRESRGGVINWTASPGDYSWPNDLKVFGDDPENAAYASAGSSLNDATATSAVDVSLFEFRPENQPLLAIGQLQHSNLAWITNYPSYAIGNSLGAPALSGTPAALMKITNPTGAYDLSLPNRSSAYYDMSWLLNHALWDKYFVSTVPYEGSGKATDTDTTTIPDPLPNPRHVRYVSPTDSALTIAQRDSNLRDINKAAAGLLLHGGFNINSTSEQAWRAVLGGANLLDFEPVNQQVTGTRLSSAMSRFSKPLSGSPAVAAIDATNVWTGYKALDATQIAVLAQKIVAEIRSRGPSISLSDFINRRLVHSRDSSGADPFPRENDRRLKGAIQAAIDATPTGTGVINSNTTTPFMTPLVSENYSAAVTNVFKAGMVDSTNTLKVIAPVSANNSFSPQYLTQADVLSAIGNGLSARSDTFVIRTYGEAINPTDSAQITGRAWCEAVVQRTPEYVDSIGDPLAQNAPNITININMGRRYKVVSFRWLTANDI